MARTTIATPGFLDRLGDRVVVTDRTGGDLEVLRLRPDLTGDPGFETDLKARAEQVAGFQHRAAARVRGISRLPGADGRLAVVSDVAKGWRLSEVLQAAEHEGRLIHTSSVLFLLRQVASVVTALQACGPDIGHGALGPERVVLSPAGRVLVVEYVLGSALEHLPALPADRMWKEFRLAVPPDAAAPRFGPHTDVVQLGIIALSLVHNRLLKRDEYPARLPELLDSATESQVTGARQPLGRVLRDWLENALGLLPVGARWTMEDAQRGLDWIASTEGGYFSTPVGLEPLLQSVERFFTMAPAETDDPAPITEHSTAHTVTPEHAELPGQAAAPPPPAPVAAAVPAIRAVEPAPEPRGLTLVKTGGDAVVSLTPASELLGRTEGSESDDSAGAADPLIVMPSPLAEFAAERVVDSVPVAADPASETASLRPAPWPVPARPSPSAAQADAPPDVAPLADMLSIDRPTGKRRSGWNGEAWQSRSTDRQPSGSRTVVSTAGQTVRLSKSGGAATAAALRPRDESALPEPVSAHEVQPVVAKEAVLSPLAEGHPAPPVKVATQPSASGAHAVASGAHAVASGAHTVASGAHTVASGAHTVASGAHTVAAAGAHAAAADSRPATAAPARSFFGLSEGAEHHGAHEEPRHARQRGSMKWPAAAALLILCGGGFAAWKFLGTSPAPAPAAEPSRSSSAGATRPGGADVKAAVPVPGAEAPKPAAAAPSALAAPAAVEAAPVTGTLQFVSPIVVSVSERGEALGTSAAPLTLAAGHHVLDLVSEELGYRATRAVDVRAGRVTRAELALPNGSVNINATPWAEVLVDGRRVGETPLGNVQLTIGSHEVTFRHPQLGEQVRAVVITTGAPGRLSVDMKQ